MVMVEVVAFVLGTALSIAAPVSAVSTFVLPRGVRDPLARLVFAGSRLLFDLCTPPSRPYAQRDRIMALYAPITLLLLPVVWLGVVLVGFTAMFWAVGVRPLEEAFRESGSSLLTLGFATADGLPATILTFVEATLGITLAALLIAYLPTMYAAWQRREAGVALIEVRAGSPPSPVEMLLRVKRLERLDLLHDVFREWEGWFHDVGETHTSLASLVYFRSSHPDQSWVNTSATVIDAAALTASTLDKPRDVTAELCLRAGYLALRRIADFFNAPYDADPDPGDPISIPRELFDEAYDRMAAAGVPLRPDRDQAWSDFAGWRVNYDAVVNALAVLTMAPEAPWLPARRAPR